MLSVIMLSVIMLSVIMLSVIMMNVIKLKCCDTDCHGVIVQTPIDHNLYRKIGYTYLCTT
jgi:hypothetical protein